MTQAFPIQWPKGQSRAKRRVDSQFRVKASKAYDEMMDELHRFKASGIVISSNIPLRQDGTPYRDGLTDLFDDPGVAVYFTKNKRQICLPCDTYRRPWENCRAISKAIEALRSMERHGAHQILNQAFSGFTALPAPSAVAPDICSWWSVLGVTSDASREQIHDAYKAKCRENGGASVELNQAKELGLTAA